MEERMYRLLVLGNASFIFYSRVYDIFSKLSFHFIFVTVFPFSAELPWSFGGEATFRHPFLFDQSSLSAQKTITFLDLLALPTLSPSFPVRPACPACPANPSRPSHEFCPIKDNLNRQRLPFQTILHDFWIAWQLNFMSMYIDRSTLEFTSWVFIRVGKVSKENLKMNEKRTNWSENDLKNDRKTSFSPKNDH